MGGVYNMVNMHLYHYAGNNPLKYTDPDGRSPRSTLWKALGAGSFIGAGAVGVVTVVGIISSGGTLSVALPVAAKASSLLVSAGTAAFATAALVETMDAVVSGPTILTATEKKPKTEQEMKPDGAPTGTKPIDQAGLGTKAIYDIKKNAGLRPNDWTGISPNDDVIINDGTGKAANLGPYTDFTQ
jgi:hypothetical protein